MKKEILTAAPFAGERDLGFRLESGGGTAQLQFKKSDGTFANQPDSSYSLDELFRLDMYSDQVYQWVLTGSAKILRES